MNPLTRLSTPQSPLSRAPAHNSTGRNYSIHPSGHLYVFPSALHPSSESSPYSALEAARLPLAHTMRHPIRDLISNATREWEKKLARQSKTLEQAVREYRRRHGRRPPKGFDDWCVHLALCFDAAILTRCPAGSTSPRRTT